MYLQIEITSLSKVLQSWLDLEFLFCDGILIIVFYVINNTKYLFYELGKRSGMRRVGSHP